ncbi:MAG: alpha/beta fold hydrolase [Gammaproteobacteria bacterium]|nr:alpha/beta fold hydrolase [Gammaproteobacteria bacterium]
MNTRALTLAGPEGPLSAELLNPTTPVALVVLAHGAGADFRHANMLAIAEAFADQQIATLRFNFPFMEKGRRRVDRPDVSMDAIAAAVVAAAEEGLPLYLGGHSFGGRMASHAVVERELPVRGLIFCSFPLHQPKKPSLSRAEHLPRIDVPMLFLSGTRDALAEPVLLEEVIAGLGKRAMLHWLDTADHSYKILKRQRPASPTVFEEMAGVARAFITG